MNLKAINNFFQILNKDNQCFIYSGNFSDEITEKIISLNKNHIQNDQVLSKLTNKVSFLMAECFQNIVRHGESEPMKYQKEEMIGFFITRNINSNLFISSANQIPNNDIPLLESKINQVNTLDKKELKTLYLDILKNKELSEKGGAGLGLIEMARRSGQTLDFNFEKIDDQYSFFFLQINVNKNIINNQNGSNDLSPISDIICLRKMLWENNVIMIHKGDFSQDALIPILKMIENNMRGHFSKKDRKKKQMFHLMVEILQNISRHAFINQNTKDAIFIVSQKKNDFSINAGNYIENKYIPEFEKQLKLLNSLNKEGLDKLYLDTLKNGMISEKGGAGLGLIDIVKDSSRKVEFEFIRRDNKVSFFSLHVQI